MKKILLIPVIFVIFLLSCFYNSSDDLGEIKSRGVLLVGTTGDYYPMSFFDKNKNSYTGFDIDLSKDLAKSLGVNIKFVPTTWSTLTNDTINKKFDIAISGITITDERKKHALMSKKYLSNGKTILCRKEDENKYTDLESINQPYVKVIENAGGLNEQFARENLPKANLIIHNVNYEIPDMIASGKADVMITEVIEANYYSHINKKLSAPLAKTPFTQGEIGMMIPKEKKQLLKYTNKFIDKEINCGQIDDLIKKYILVNN